MKRLTKAAAFLVGSALATQSGWAQLVPNDLYMGFQNQAGGGTADYIINLGSASALTGLIGTSTTVNLSGDFSLANFDSASLQGTSASGIMGGVVGASNGGSPSDVFLTQLRAGGAGSAGVAGSSAPTALSRSQDNTAYSVLTQIDAPAAGSGVLDSSKSWENFVEPTFTSGSFYGSTGSNPDSPASASTVLYEDLWETSSSSISGSKPFNYEGYFTLNLTGSSPSLTFTAAPEPSSYMISAAGGLLLLVLRNRFSRRNS
jgi:hypothetical protein